MKTGKDKGHKARGDVKHEFIQFSRHNHELIFTIGFQNFYFNFFLLAAFIIATLLKF